MSDQVSSKRRLLEYCGTAVWGYSKPCLQQEVLYLLNTPNGSWGIIQIQPTGKRVITFWNTPSGSWGIVLVQPRGLSLSPRPDLNHPPAAAGGIREDLRRRHLVRGSFSLSVVAQAASL